ncbi:hypothetical protein OUZ56_024077 [Daphnia magna]|uniref:Uncharacterized protein n=1 Tax=Daphnia magna TaxID=35525 RepID=A0ABR0B026_9CRUS|nr:hypothetical protein OUZ56_024077 [Daphnia magna]
MNDFDVCTYLVVASKNWEGKAKQGSLLKRGLKDSIITKAVFEGVRTPSRKPDNFELESITKKILKGMPEKYRNRCAAENAIIDDRGSGNRWDEKYSPQFWKRTECGFNNRSPEIALFETLLGNEEPFENAYAVVTTTTAAEFNSSLCIVQVAGNNPSSAISTSD